MLVLIFLQFFQHFYLTLWDRSNIPNDNSNNCLFHVTLFFTFLAKSRYLSSFSLTFNFIQSSAGTVKSIIQVFFLFIKIRSDIDWFSISQIIFFWSVPITLVCMIKFLSFAQYYDTCFVFLFRLNCYICLLLLFADGRWRTWRIKIWSKP